MRVFQLKASPVRMSQHHFFNNHSHTMKGHVQPVSRVSPLEYKKSLMEMSLEELNKCIVTKKKKR